MSPWETWGLTWVPGAARRKLWTRHQSRPGCCWRGSFSLTAGSGGERAPRRRAGAKGFLYFCLGLRLEKLGLGSQGGRTLLRALLFVGGEQSVGVCRVPQEGGDPLGTPWEKEALALLSCSLTVGGGCHLAHPGLRCGGHGPWRGALGLQVRSGLAGS